MKRYVAIMVLTAMIVIGGGIAYWWNNAPEPSEPTNRNHTQKAPPEADFRAELENARVQLANATAQSLASQLDAYLNAQEQLAKQTGSPTNEKRLDELIALHAAAGESVNLMPQILLLCNQILRVTPDHENATRWRLDAILAQAPKQGPLTPAIENAWKAARDQATRDAEPLRTFCNYLLGGTDAMRQRALHMAEEAVTATNSFESRLLLLEIQLNLAQPNTRRPIERRILAFQRRPPRDLPPSQTVRLARLSALADPLPVADNQQTLAAGILRAQRLLADAIKRQPGEASLLKAGAIQAVWAGQSEQANSYAKKLLALNQSSESILDRVRHASNQRDAYLIIALTRLHNLRQIDSNTDLATEREFLNDAYQAIVAHTGTYSWETQMLTGMTEIMVGSPDAGVTTLTTIQEAAPPELHPLIKSWLGLGAWRSGNPEATIAQLRGLPKIASLPVSLRREAATLTIRSHLLLRDVKAAKAEMPTLEGLVQEDAPLDHANLLIHLVQSVVENRAANPLAVVSALKRLQKNAPSRTTDLLNAAFAKAINQSERARIRAASLATNYPEDKLCWYFQHALLTPGTPAAVRSCKQMLSQASDNTAKDKLRQRLERPLPDTDAIARQILAITNTIKTESQRMLAEASLQEGDYPNAIANFSDPTLIFATHVKAGNLEEARAHLSSLTKSSPETSLAKATMEHKANRPALALRTLAKYPSTPGSDLLRARLHFDKHQNSEAQSILRKVLKTRPQHLEARKLLIDSLLTKDQTSAANEQYAQHVQQTLPLWLMPALVDRLGCRAPLLALSRLSQNLATERIPPPTKPGYNTTFGTLPKAAADLAEKGRDAAARSLIARFARTPNQFPWEARQLARAAAQVPDTKLAHNYYNRAAQLDTSTLQATLIEWLKWSASDSPDDAPLKHLSQHPKKQRPSVRIAAAYLALELGDYALVESLLKGTNNTADILTLRGEIQLQSGRDKAAGDLFAQALAIDPNSPRARLGMAKLAEAWPEAAADIATAIREIPNDAKILISSAQIASEHNRNRETIRYVQQAIMHTPKNTKANAQAADLLVASGAWQELEAMIGTHKFSHADANRIRLQLAYLLGDQPTVLEFIPQVISDTAEAPSIAVTVIRAAMELGQFTTAKKLAAQLKKLTKPTPEQQAAALLPELSKQNEASRTLAALIPEQRWIALALAESPLASRADRNRALASALANPAPWQFPDLRAAARLAETFPSVELRSLLERQESTASLPASTQSVILGAVGVIHTKFGMPKKAIEWYRRSLRIESNVRVQLLLAQAFGATGDAAKAEEILDPLSLSQNSDVENELLATRRILAHHQYVQAHGHGTAETLFHAGGHVAATNLLLSLNKWSERQRGIARQLLNTRLQEMHYEALSSRLTQIGNVHQEITDLDAIQTRVSFLLERQDHVGARKFLLESIRVTNSNLLRLQLANVCDRLGWHEEAVKHRHAAAAQQLPE